MQTRSTSESGVVSTTANPLLIMEKVVLGRPTQHVGIGSGHGYAQSPESAEFAGQGAEHHITSEDYQLERGLKSRHIQFLALGESQRRACFPTCHTRATGRRGGVID